MDIIKQLVNHLITINKQVQPQHYNKDGNKMRQNKNTITSPELFVDDHHGQYMGQIAWQQLAPFYKNQALKVLSAEVIASLEAGPEDEWHCDACDSLMNVEFKSATGQKLFLTYAEGGIWVISACFLRSKAANEFFGN